VAQALSGPFLIAALTLCTAGVAKLRAPATAVDALRAVGLSVDPLAVRAFAGGELALGAAAVLSADAVVAIVLAALYAGFAVLTLVLHRRNATCGCFGETGAPASRAQSAISAALAVVCAAAAVGHAHGAPWILARSPLTAASLLIGIGAAVFATVVAYSELPAAWNAWSGR
jgi:hypothetical protein